MELSSTTGARTRYSRCREPAAVSQLSDTLRMELQPFGIRAVYMSTGIVGSNITLKQMRDMLAKLPQNSFYEPVRAEVEEAWSGKMVRGKEMDADVFARKVVADLLDGWFGTPVWILRGWTGTTAWWIPFLGCFWKGLWDPFWRRFGGVAFINV